MTEKKLYTATELAEKMELHRSTIYKWTKRGLPVVPKGGRTYFDYDQVKEWERQQVIKKGLTIWEEE